MSHPTRRVHLRSMALGVVTVGLAMASLTPSAPAGTIPAASAPASAELTSAPDPDIRLVDDRYLVTLSGTQGPDGFDLAGSAAAVDTLVKTAGGSVVADLSDQIGVLVVHASSPTFTSALEGSILIDSVGQDFGVKMYAGDAPDPLADPLEPFQWDMQQIRTEDAHATQAGVRAVDVG
ncbi:MAG: hypothetical protein M3Q82_06730, partial [Actinomycetota bacterium]|nr:hypothetical protein [Actinomycetota bacterium]